MRLAEVVKAIEEAEKYKEKLLKEAEKKASKLIENGRQEAKEIVDRAKDKRALIFEESFAEVERKIKEEARNEEKRKEEIIRIIKQKVLSEDFVNNVLSFALKEILK